MMKENTRLRQTVEALARRGDASGAMAFSDGESGFCCAFGWADQRASRPMTPEQRFCLSLQGQFPAAMAALLLIQEKRLGFNDSVSRYLPEYPGGDRITIRQLLSSGSGVPDLAASVSAAREHDPAYRALSPAKRIKREREAAARGWSETEALPLLGKLPADFPPGSRKNEYSPSNALLLCFIAQRAASQSLFDILNQRLFLPLGVEAREGNHSDCLSYARLDGRRLLPLNAAAPCRYCCTMDIRALSALAAGLGAGLPFTPAMARRAYRATGEGMTYSGARIKNGVLMGWFDGPLGFTANVYFDRETKVHYACALSGDQKLLYLESEPWAFLYQMRRAVEGATQRFHSPKMEPLHVDNVENAMDLAILPEQKNFVMAAKDTICYSAADPRRKLFVCVDRGRAAGLIMLLCDPRHGDFGIDVLLVDKRCQHLGYGRFMLRYGIDFLRRAGARELTIGVSRFNTIAMELYQSEGFRPWHSYEQGAELRLVL